MASNWMSDNERQQKNMASVKTKLKKLEREQNEAADKVCWTLILLMSFGGLDLPNDEREIIAEPMEKWADISDEYEKLAAKTR
jgi:hypothetical protein